MHPQPNVHAGLRRVPRRVLCFLLLADDWLAERQIPEQIARADLALSTRGVRRHGHIRAVLGHRLTQEALNAAACSDAKHTRAQPLHIRYAQPTRGLAGKDAQRTDKGLGTASQAQSASQVGRRSKGRATTNMRHADRWTDRRNRQGGRWLPYNAMTIAIIPALYLALSLSRYLSIPRAVASWSH